MFYSRLDLGFKVGVIFAIGMVWRARVLFRKLRHRKWIGRRISKILRVTAKSRGLSVQSDGYITIAGLLALLEKDHIFMRDHDLIDFVQSDSKTRYGIRDDLIRAHQGHAMSCVKLEHTATRLILGEYMPYTVAYHGTTWKAWEEINKEGLSKRGRIAIHCAIGLPGDPKVKSGMRCDSECIIKVNMADAMRGGLVFFISDNMVVLCEGPINRQYLQLTE